MTESQEHFKRCNLSHFVIHFRFLLLNSFSCSKSSVNTIIQSLKNILVSPYLFNEINTFADGRTYKFSRRFRI